MTANVNAISVVVFFGIPMKPEAPPVSLVVLFNRAVIASPNPSVTRDM